ncbi:MAG: [protein-PII] uridylyltransferase [Gammaproteobacteria bacterium]|nr:[protein-PII] uridylyltransferase [Gammaproteobacteria bacterium]
MKNKEQDSQTLPLSALKTRIQRADQNLFDSFWSNADVEALVTRRSTFIDGFLSELWQQWFHKDQNYALMAVGGYGRGELHPKSDVDLLVLVKSASHKNETVEAFIRLLWDLGLDIGISVRTPSDCLQNARDDLTVMTSLIERRLICGSGKLAQLLDRQLDKRSLWPAKKFFQSKVSEQEARHERFADVEYGLEPDIKSSPGGLRDIQTICWVTNRAFGTDDPHELCELGVLTSRESETLLQCKRFLWKIRFALHVVSNRKTDQLLFDYQREIAERFGYQDQEGLQAIEIFMRDYYRHVLDLREVNDIVIQTIKENFRERFFTGRIRPINDRFRLRSNYLEVKSPDVFKEHPPALMELFVHLANNRGARGVRADTIRLVREHLYLIDENFRKLPEVSGYFLELLRSPHRLVSQLTRLRRYGILGRYIPEFGRVIGHMQHDLYHIYTVDAHTMMLVRNLRRFFMEDFEQDIPLIEDVAPAIDEIELLYLAAIFHDLGKGLKGDHSNLGAENALQFCKQLRLNEEQQDLVVWLVQNHLLMSTTSQRKDISSPEVIRRFAEQLHSMRYLNYLVLLTVADIKATAPKLLNSWRSSLLQQLYWSTRAVLEEGINVESDVRKNIEEKKRATARIVRERGHQVTNLDYLWDDTTDGFILNHSSEMLATMAISLDQRTSSTHPVVLLEHSAINSTVHNLYDLFICSPNRKRLFADCVTAIGHLNLEVMSARIFTGPSGSCYDSFVVMTQEGVELSKNELDRTINTVKRVLSGERAIKKRNQRIPRRLKHFNIPSKISIKDSATDGRSELELVAADRAGLLALVGDFFDEIDIDILAARISTFGERVEDYFTIANRDGTGKLSEEQLHQIYEVLPKRINMDLVEAPA